ncbi:hypothetical protein DAY19_03580 [Halobacteriovorax vibrionivorans]|uniref:Uncharacterized protein n=1 Tax=Halobacteriovorax vibrionivorans TaxID=2152716 RepID=A0ABY0INT4_9BACT|nr:MULTISPECIES: hypothetical protein [Halobacteriovorax]RZF22867.1 hypothetical protein DAY19_03580 [Halobacteriovorax vibrionivorans]TGD47340.1 hypothetical protein EP118_08470 [Halobacteriovorax sp. Y22]
MKKLIIVCLVASTTFAQVNFLQNLRPFVEKNISSELADKIWGAKDEVTLPEIPTIKKDAKDLSVYNKKKYNSPFSKEKMSQYNLSYINELIKATRGLEANRNELSKWYSTLEQGGTREGVYRSLVLSPYYQRLENYKEQTSEVAKDFTVSFFGTYLNNDLEKAKLSSLNIYSIKRITTEKSLEVMEALLGQSQENFSRWYAVLSADLAKNYPIWSSKLRSTKESGVHFRWAMKMTPDIVKSELILKLHLLFNHLQKQQ